MEIGCPAVRFGANQPNVFIDPKSSESQQPYFSDGSRDDFMQRRYLEALIAYWNEPANNPISSTYNDRMIKTDAVSVWTWDARPFPDFPARLSAWSDGVNWQTGHWITGRIGLVSLADIVRDVARQAGLSDIDVSGLNGLVQGYQIDRPMSARAALSGLGELYGFSLCERGETVTFLSLGQGDAHVIEPRQLVYNTQGTIEHFYPDPADALRDIRLHFIDSATDYQFGLASSQDRAAEAERVLDIKAPLVMDRSFANYLCDSLLERMTQQGEILRFTLSPSALAFEVGDRVTLEGVEGIWRIESLEGNGARDVKARRDVEGAVIATSGGTFETPIEIPKIARAVPLCLDLPAPFVGQAVGVFLSPFTSTDIEAEGAFATVEAPLKMGALLTDIPSGPTTGFDREASFELLMADINLNSVSEEAVLNGANRFAVETPQGWDFIQMADITLIGPHRYRCETLLRGVGSEGYSQKGVLSGARILWMGSGLAGLNLNPELIREELDLTARTNERQSRPYGFTYQATHLKPLSPVHLKTHIQGEVIRLSWIRRSRIKGDSWVGEVPLGENSERYRLRLWSHEALQQEIEITEPYYETSLEFTHFDVAQGSDVFGWGATVSLALTPAS